MRSIDLLLSCLCGSAFAVGFVFARASWPKGRRPLISTHAFARAVHFRFAVPRETNRTEYDLAYVVHVAGDASVVRKKLVLLLMALSIHIALCFAACLSAFVKRASDSMKILCQF